MIEASTVEDGAAAGTTIAVTLRAAVPAEVLERMCRVCAMTRREYDVTAAVLSGLDTHAIAERLVISALTVQDHLKSVFTKLGVRSRRELVRSFGTAVEAPDWT